MAKKRTKPASTQPLPHEPPRPERLWVELNDAVGLSEIKAETPVRIGLSDAAKGGEGYLHCALGDVESHLENFGDVFEIYLDRWVKVCRSEPPKTMQVTLTFEVVTRAYTVEDNVGHEIATIVRQALLNRDPKKYYQILDLREVYAPSETKK